MDGGYGPAKLCSSMARGDAVAVGEDDDGQGCSTRRKEEEAAAGGDGEETPAGKGLWRLADEEVQWVLSRTRTHLVSGEVSPEGVEAFESLGDSFFEYQAWVRAEYEANGGYVEVDDEFVARREEHLAMYLPMSLILHNNV
ncbi:hypothetical protein ACP70R_007640 [Stipagrostis hirtigluma subsp. patula]